MQVPIEMERLMNNEVVLEQPSSEREMDERHVSAAVLYIQAWALQGPNSSMVSIAEYRLPEAKPGTPLYFDFPTPLQSRRITFRLLGDVAAFCDDPPAEPSDGTGSPIAAGLSLGNRIKLYYYADPYDLGKWAALSAV